MAHPAQATSGAGAAATTSSTAASTTPAPPGQQQRTPQLRADEETPLLASGASSQTLRGGEGDEDGEDRQDDHAVLDTSSTEDDLPHSRDGDGGDDMDNDTPRHVIGKAKGVLLMLGLAIQIFLLVSNISSMAMTQSAIADDLDAHSSVVWFGSSAVITAASLTPLAGRFASVISPGILVLPMVGCVVVGSVVAALSPNLAVFLLGRIITGIGMACAAALGPILILELVSKRRRGLFIGLHNSAYTMGVTGVAVVGALLPVMGWRMLFLAQAPLIALAGGLIYMCLPPSLWSARRVIGRPDDHRMTWERMKGLDYLGAILLVITIVLFLYGLSVKIHPLPVILSAGTLGLLVLVEFRMTCDPVIPLAILCSRGVLFSCLGHLCIMTARWSVMYFTPIVALAARGLSPAAAGSLLIPTNVGFSIGGLAIGALHIRRAGPYWAASAASVALFAATVAGIAATTHRGAPVTVMLLVLFANGFMTGALLNYTTVHALHLSLAEDHFEVTSLLGTFRGFGNSFGTSIGGGIFFRLLRADLDTGFSRLDGGHLSDRHASLASKLVGSPVLVSSGTLTDAEQSVAIESYESAARGMFQAAAALAAVVIITQAATGWQEPVRKRATSR